MKTKAFCGMGFDYFIELLNECDDIEDAKRTTEKLRIATELFQMMTLEQKKTLLKKLTLEHIK